MKNTPSSELINRMIYMDAGYVADMYEIIEKVSPKSQITKSQSSKAGAGIPIFSAEVSAQEVRSYTVSTNTMLQSIIEVLNKKPELDLDNFRIGMPSKYGWLDGNLTVFGTHSSYREIGTGREVITASDAFFQIKGKKKFALITTPEYFISGIGAFIKLRETILSEMEIPVRAYIRVMAARTHTNGNGSDKDWIAIPLLIMERTNAENKV